MAWIKVDTNLLRNPKTVRLARLLEIGVTDAAGLLVALWIGTMLYAEDGELTKYTAQGIADLADWKGDADLFYHSMLVSNLLDMRGRGKGRVVYVHDWRDHAAGFLQAKYGRQPEKWKIVKAALDQRKSFTPRRMPEPTDAAEPPRTNKSLLSSPGKETPPPNHSPNIPQNELLNKNLQRQIMDSHAGKEVMGETKTRYDEIFKAKEKRSPHPRKKIVAKTKDAKVKHLECVFISTDELAKLRVLYGKNEKHQLDMHGDERLQHGIQKLNDYIMARNKTRTYKSHYHVLKGWVLIACYEDEMRGRLRFQPVQKDLIRQDITFCHDCDQWVKTKDWSTHPCQRNEDAITTASVDEAVKTLRDRLRMHPKRS